MNYTGESCYTGYMTQAKRIMQSLTLTGSVFGLVGFFYIAGNSWFHRETLPLPLTHFAPYPREDTFGALCFLTAMVSFFSYTLLKTNVDKRQK